MSTVCTDPVAGIYLWREFIREAMIIELNRDAISRLGSDMPLSGVCFRRGLQGLLQAMSG